MTQLIFAWAKNKFSIFSGLFLVFLSHLEGTSQNSGQFPLNSTFFSHYVFMRVLYDFNNKHYFCIQNPSICRCDGSTHCSL